MSFQFGNEQFSDESASADTRVPAEAYIKCVAGGKHSSSEQSEKGLFPDGK